VQPFTKDVLRYKEKYYQISDQRIPYHRNKTEDERFFILTLFAIANEIEASGCYSDTVFRIQLAIGVPPAHYGALNKAYRKFFSNRGTVGFSYRGKAYTIFIDNVACYPQAYAAAVTILSTLREVPKALILDIGGFTADYLQIRRGQGDLTVCDSLENGVIMLYNKIKSKANAELNLLRDEEEIDRILKGENPYVSAELRKLIDRLAQSFISDLFNSLRERQLELKSCPVIFVGGGSVLLQRQIESSGMIPNPIFISDIRANAKGFEILYRAQNSR